MIDHTFVGMDQESPLCPITPSDSYARHPHVWKSTLKGRRWLDLCVGYDFARVRVKDSAFGQISVITVLLVLQSACYYFPGRCILCISTSYSPKQKPPLSKVFGKQREIKYCLSPSWMWNVSTQYYCPGRYVSRNSGLPTLLTGLRQAKGL